MTDGRISEIGAGLAGDRVLEADGHVVTPGFVDIHSHYDAQVDAIASAVRRAETGSQEGRH